MRKPIDIEVIKEVWLNIDWKEKINTQILSWN